MKGISERNNDSEHLLVGKLLQDLQTGLEITQGNRYQSSGGKYLLILV